MFTIFFEYVGLFNRRISGADFNNLYLRDFNVITQIFHKEYFDELGFIFFGGRKMGRVVTRCQSQGGLGNE